MAGVILGLSVVAIVGYKPRYRVEAKYIVQRPTVGMGLQAPALLGASQNQTTLNALEDAYLFRELLKTAKFSRFVLQKDSLSYNNCMNLQLGHSDNGDKAMRLIDRVSISIDPTSAMSILQISCDRPEAALKIAEYALLYLKEYATNYNAEILERKTKESESEVRVAENAFKKLLMLEQTKSMSLGVPSLDSYETVAKENRYQLEQNLTKAKADLFALRARQSRLFSEKSSEEIRVAEDTVRGLNASINSLQLNNRATGNIDKVIGTQLRTQLKAAQMHVDSSRLRLAEDKRSAQEQSRFITIIDVPSGKPKEDQRHKLQYFAKLGLVLFLIYLGFGWISRARKYSVN
jgi:hypothetical protein